jgi:HTH-type transcriptional regulator, competence development regulator
MRFGQKIRQLRQAKGLGQRALAQQVGSNFTYISKIETGKLDYSSYPSEAMIHKLAEALDADEDELLLLAEKIPEKIKTMVLQRPEAFRKLAELDGRKPDKLLRTVDGEG